MADMLHNSFHNVHWRCCGWIDNVASRTREKRVWQAEVEEELEHYSSQSENNPLEKEENKVSDKCLILQCCDACLELWCYTHERDGDKCLNIVSQDNKK